MKQNDDENDNNKISLKTVLVGETSVGKTSIIKQFTKNIFDPEVSSSIGSQYSSKIINIKKFGKNIKFDLWDTAGQEIYRSLAKIFYQDAKIIIFVYDITNKKSLESLKNYWYKQISTNSDKNVIFALVGNKSDLYNFQQVNDDEAKEFAESIGAILQFTSAKSNIGIDKLFQIIGRKYFDPEFDYKNEEESEKELYKAKKENKQKIKEKKIEEEDNEENNTSITSIKLYKETFNPKEKTKCC